MDLLYNLYTGFLLILLFLAWRVVYNRYFHPLSRYPGPFIWGVSRIPYAAAYARGNLHRWVQHLHDQYGDVVRVAPDELSYRNEQAWRDIHGPSRNFPKDMRFYHASKAKAPSVVVAPDPVHGRQKRAILRAFSEPALKSHERLLRPFVDTLMQKLQQVITEKRDHAVDMTEWYNYVMFDFMSLELFGESLGCLEQGTYHPWVDMLFGSIKAWAFLSQSKYFPSLSWIIKAAVLFFCRDLLHHRTTKLTSIASKVDKGKVSELDQPTFSAYIRASKDPRSTLSEEEILSNHSFMMMAGSETTATLLSGCTFFVLKDPEIYKEISFQIRHRFSSPSEITFSSLSSIPYLRAVLQETLRMYPPLPLGMPRLVPGGGAMVSGQFVPEKTSVAVASWATYQSSSNFKDPQLFLPERWLGTGQGDEDVKAAMQPFSVGPRACPGRSLAFAEASLILARLIWQFDLELLPECFSWADQRAYIIWDKPPLLTKLTPRT
ncbi:cytochrome P450 monooxygenase [Aspergillus nomiae NRRL 13137]|uniref:Cytochrome P450 monooxygenase n=1 Tax=Aspergillus nomiae NRRL (strain ATCC 15546 / NRRL 13137 / CBS 260.88 / M93) TaxID=1509407 RepID=A0A0L1J0D7_ASPN3|nr:cytochrome P450 monooxygenase [Aspergillus nomiae NRRL 13137]KNG84868.1 cytochrome P450 monooxygenase [Aspergillus nomiae NRRL 13137]